MEIYWQALLDAIGRFLTWAAPWLPGNDAIVRDIIKYVIVSAIAFAGGWLLRLIWKFIRRILQIRTSAFRLRAALETVRSNKGVWISRPPARAADYEGQLDATIPIITLGNLKGGVGKTTIAANLAGELADEGETVLLIDLDFQGSLSSMVFGEDTRDKRPKGDDLSLASQALLQGQTGQWLVSKVEPTKASPNLFVVPAFYDLARVENRLLVEWLLLESEDDMRYRLHALLQSREVQQKFSIVIIDAAPRMTASTIQALSASTHVLIPTVMDQLSAEAVKTFIVELQTLQTEGASPIAPKLKLLGVVGNMLPGGAATWHRPTVNELQDALRESQSGAKLLNEGTWIKDMPALSRAAGEGIGVLAPVAADRKQVKEAFEGLVQHVRRHAPPKRRT